VARIKASVEAMGKNPDCLEVLLGQLVNLIISGEQVRMGKRRKMLTLEDLIKEVGVDGTRFWMIMRSIDTTLDFDVDLAKSCSDENPVFYLQYAHARVCSILRTATAERFDQDNKTQLPPFITQEELNNLVIPEKFDKNILESLWKTNSEKELESTKALVLKLESFEDLVETSAKTRAPYMIARYCLELAKDFHYFYTFTRVLNVEDDVMKARLGLINATRQVFANALEILGVSAPQSM
jgi:arginyl-tRNA synthetase